MIEHLGHSGQLVSTTYNMDMLDLYFLKHCFVFLRKGGRRMQCLCYLYS